jgi:hypothetical protein
MTSKARERIGAVFHYRIKARPPITLSLAQLWMVSGVDLAEFSP